MTKQELQKAFDQTFRLRHALRRSVLESHPQVVRTPPMIQVTKDSFYATAGPMNVHPRPIDVDGKWGLASEWFNIATREVFGKTTFRRYEDGAAVYDYFVTEMFFASHKDTLVAQPEAAP